MRDKRGYYYRKKREGGRVVSEYLGSGEAAELALVQDALDAEEHRAQRAEIAAQVEQWKGEDKTTKAAFDLVSQVLGVAFESAGYWQHARGEWRKRRAISNNDMAKSKAGGLVKTTDMMQLMSLAQSGDSQAAQDFLATLRGQPGEGEMIAVFADLGTKAQNYLLEQMGINTPFLSGVFSRQLDLMRQDLGGKDAPPLERMLIERIVTCWIVVN